MNQADFDRIVRSTIQSIENLLIVKGGEYAGSDDRLANFKRGAVLTGTHPLQVLFIYMAKHYDAVATFVRDTAAGTTRPMSESIEGRLDDLINYCLLAKALIKEHREVAHTTGLLQSVEAGRAKAPARGTESGSAPVSLDVSSRDGRLNDDRVWHSPPHTGVGVPAFRDIHDTQGAPSDYDHLHGR